MDRTLLCAALALCCALAACSSRESTPQDTTAASAPAADRSASATPSPAPAPVPTMVSPVGDPGAANDGYPDFTPPPLTPEAERGEQGARNRLTSWAQAIEMDEPDQAWAMMGRAGKAKWTEDEFDDLFNDLTAITVTLRGGQMEGAAGSLFYSVPTVITATDSAAKPVRFTGELVLRRVNDVPGASPEQLRWHFERVTLNRAK